VSFLLRGCGSYRTAAKCFIMLNLLVCKPYARLLLWG
jgi:hypothetical protein